MAISGPWDPFHYPILKISRTLGAARPDCWESWMVSRQRCGLGACPIWMRNNTLNNLARGLDNSRGVIIIFYIGHWSWLQVFGCIHSSWSFQQMMTSSNGNIFRFTGPLCGEFTGHQWIPLTKPVTRSFDVFSDLRMNKRLSKQSRRRWSQTQSLWLWCHCNECLHLWELTDTFDIVLFPLIYVKLYGIAIFSLI